MKKVAGLLIVMCIFLLPIVSYADEVHSLLIRGKGIGIGDTADQVFKVLKKKDMINQEVSKDPNNPDSLLIIKNYNVKGKKFTIHFARNTGIGPYIVVKILLNK